MRTCVSAGVSSREFEFSVRVGESTPGDDGGVATMMGEEGVEGRGEEEEGEEEEGGGGEEEEEEE